MLQDAREQNGYVLHTLKTLELAGIECTEFLRELGVNRDALYKDSDALTQTQYSQLLDKITGRHPEEGLGLRDGQGVTILEHGLLGYAMFASKNLQKAIERHTQYQDVIGAALHTRLFVEGKSAYLRVIDVARPDLVNTPAKLRYETERLLAQWAEIGPAFGKTTRWYRRLDIAYPEPSYKAIYQEVLGDAIRFNSEHTQIVFAYDLLERPPSFANESAAQLCEQQCESLLKQLNASEGTRGKVRRLLANSHGDYPSIAETASKLIMSERSLRRRLAKEGVTYKAVLLEFRMELASSYLKGQELTIQEVAYVTGYADPSNFHRAFCQYHGETPANFRAHNREPGVKK